MPIYRARENADVWRTYLGGELGSKYTFVRAGTTVEAREVGNGVLSIVGDGYTKLRWFDLVSLPNPEPDPAPVPTPDPVEVQLVEIALVDGVPVNIFTNGQEWRKVS